MPPRVWKHPDCAARWVIMLSHLYYDRDVSLVEDGEFDRLCTFVADNWEGLEPVRQFQLESADAVRASGHHIKITQLGVAAAERLWRERHPRTPLRPYEFSAAGGPDPHFLCLFSTLKG